jgi:hypothetical protein
MGNAQTNITKVEYYIDTDPGVGNATSISITPAIDISNQALNLDVSALSNGIHKMVIRAQNANGVWSHNNTWVFAKAFASLAAAAIANITNVEYYIDIDPGVGSATAVSITSGTDIANTPVNIDMTVLTTGLHKMVIRAKDANGVWSHNNTWVFAKAFASLAPAAIANITNVEYYIDTDPGVGNATAVSITSGTDIANTPVSIDMTTLTTGLHKMVIRAKDANGIWSHNNTWVFAKAFASLAPAAIANITNVEYYIDTDPGVGNATAVSITSGTDIANTPVSIDMTVLATGLHKMVVRAKDANGVWSHNNTWVFAKAFASLAPAAISNIVQVEYFIDTNDPGLGAAKQISITPATNITDLNVNADVTGLAAGAHFVRVRAKDAYGVWSHVNSLSFSLTSNTLPLTLLAFNASLNNSTVTTNWQTTNEVNTNYFNIAYSKDGIQFESIGKVNAKGSGNYSFNQTLSSTDLEAPILYYRLQQFDKDGSFTYSNIIPVLLQKKQGLVIYPNPVKEILHSQLFASNSEVVAITVTDLQGKIVQQYKLQLQQGSNSINLNVSTLSVGSYVLTIQGRSLQQKKFIKE